MFTITLMGTLETYIIRSHRDVNAVFEAAFNIRLDFTVNPNDYYNECRNMLSKMFFIKETIKFIDDEPIRVILVVNTGFINLVHEELPF